MNKNYLIQWTSKTNGRSGRGTKLFEKAEAARLVEELNREYPQIEHRLLEAQTDPSSPATKHFPEMTPSAPEPVEEPSTPAAEPATATPSPSLQVA